MGVYELRGQAMTRNRKRTAVKAWAYHSPLGYYYVFTTSKYYTKWQIQKHNEERFGNGSAKLTVRVEIRELPR